MMLHFDESQQQSSASESACSHLSFAIKQKSASGNGGLKFFLFMLCLNEYFVLLISISLLESGELIGNGSAYERIGTSAMNGL